MIQVVGHLPSKYEAPSSILSTAKKNYLRHICGKYDHLPWEPYNLVPLISDQFLHQTGHMIWYSGMNMRPWLLALTSYSQGFLMFSTMIPCHFTTSQHSSFIIPQRSCV
jgi:hypothetical protein